MTSVPRPQPGAPHPYAFPEVARAALANGLRIAVSRMPRLPLVTVLALVDAGASRDAREAEGSAALTASALGEGTKRLDGADLAEQFELLGTGLDGTGNWDGATVRLTVTPPRLEAAIVLLGEVLSTPAFRGRDVERLKAERLAELLRLQAEPRALADAKFAEFLYVMGSRYAIPEGGNLVSVRSLDTAKARAFHNRYYTPRTTTLIFVGDVTFEQATLLTERALGAWSGGVPAVEAVDDRTVSETRRVMVVHKVDAPQSELRVGHRGVPRRHEDYFPIMVMNALLGGLFSSRINLNLRERNAFTYGARSAFDWRRGSGPFVVSTAVKSDVTDAATREIIGEITQLREETIGDGELSLATAYLDGVFPIRYETTNAVADAIAIAEMYNLGEDYYDRYRERVRAVTIADVRLAAETHLHPDELLVLAVGDANAICEPLRQLALGPIEVHEAEEQGASR
jgi:predicted Zn-dependent peptidase